MKSTLIIVILALACGYGLFTQYTSKEKQLADAQTRGKALEAEIASRKPGLEKIKARVEELKKTLSDTELNNPETEYAAALKPEEAKLADAKAKLAEEEARTVPDPPVPPVAAADIAASEKELADINERLAKMEKFNVELRKHRAEEAAMAPKSKK